MIIEGIESAQLIEGEYREAAGHAMHLRIHYTLLLACPP